MTDKAEALAHLARIGVDVVGHRGELEELYLQRDAWASLARMLGATFQEIGDAAGVSKERIFQLLND